MNNELEHYGVLGMKWGVRRTPEQLGRNPRTGKYVPHTIKEGTKVYRVSAKPGDAKGATYVSMLPPDRDLYRGSYSKVISKQQGGKGEAYETSYKIKKDLRIANRKDIADQFEQIKSDKKIMEGIARTYTKASIEIEKKSGWMYDDEDIRELSKYYLNRYLKQWGSLPAQEQYSVMARSISFNAPGLKEKVIEGLKSKGFDGLIDEAGVGGLISPREGVEPLILFDAETVLSKQGSSVITDKVKKGADKRYRNWQWKTNYLFKERSDSVW